MNNNPSKCLLFLLFFSHSVVFKSLWPKDCSTSGFLVLHYLLELFKLMSTESVMPSNHLILCRPLLLCLSVIKKWAWEGGSEGTCVYLWLIHVDLWQRPTQYCKAIILQLKVNRLKKKKEMSKLRWWNEGEWNLSLKEEQWDQGNKYNWSCHTWRNGSVIHHVVMKVSNGCPFLQRKAWNWWQIKTDPWIWKR